MEDVQNIFASNDEKRAMWLHPMIRIRFRAQAQLFFSRADKSIWAKGLRLDTTTSIFMTSAKVFMYSYICDEKGNHFGENTFHVIWKTGATYSNNMVFNMGDGFKKSIHDRAPPPHSQYHWKLSFAHNAQPRL